MMKRIALYLLSSAKRFSRRSFLYRRRPFNLQRILFSLVCICTILLFYLAYKLTSDYVYISLLQRRRAPPIVDYVCAKENADYYEIGNSLSFPSPSSLKTEEKVLLLVETQYSNLGIQISQILDYMKVQYKHQVLGKSLPPLTNMAKGRYVVIIFENLYKYLNMDQWNRQLLDKYCKDYGASIMVFMPSRQDLKFERAKVRGFPLFVHQNLRVYNAYINDNTSLLYITRPGQLIYGPVGTKNDWVGFDPQHKTYESVLNVESEYSVNPDSPSKNLSVCLLDTGQLDGVRRLYFGNDFNSFWLLKLIFVDGLRYLSQGMLSLSLTRYLQVDIDDIFVGEKNYKMNVEDVKELLAAQKRLRNLVPKFTFNLGFSGKFFRRGNWYEEQGDLMLVESAQNFWWFPHQWRHNQPHKTNVTLLESLMQLNKRFAEEHKIPVQWPYSVAPHHSGVYPVHDALYEAWRSVWNIRVTSTEEYPHLKPASQRRGFIYKDIMVLPRQTCGLYTHTVFLETFPGGRPRLDQSIKGGDLFFTFVFNPFLIFMTHQANYAHDRLALYTFETVIRFVQCWTNLKIKAVSPLQLAEKYFRRFPEEKDPIWGNPCLDKRHLAIWSAEKSCEQFPKAIILGPQKTGTTALYTFLKLHPHVRSNTNSNKTFEEVQFFNGKNYRNGIDWYMDYFPLDYNATGVYFFEKSATYFDSELSPRRVQSLLPRAKLIAILVSPAKRAYSWYQHQKAHNDKTALRYQFYDVLKASEESPKELWQLRQHCLNPGHYSQHIERWLNYFPAKQLMIMDGEQLKTDPINAMSSVQNFLELQPRLNYSELLKFSSKKGFYCVVERNGNNNKTQCLGRGKGRQYEAMSEDAHRWLLTYFRPHNIALHRLLTRFGYTTPNWLQQELQINV